MSFYVFSSWESPDGDYSILEEMKGAVSLDDVIGKLKNEFQTTWNSYADTAAELLVYLESEEEICSQCIVLEVIGKTVFDYQSFKNQVMAELTEKKQIEDLDKERKEFEKLKKKFTVVELNLPGGGGGDNVAGTDRENCEN